MKGGSRPLLGDLQQLVRCEPREGARLLETAGSSSTVLHPEGSALVAGWCCVEVASKQVDTVETQTRMSSEYLYIYIYVYISAVVL